MIAWLMIAVVAVVAIIALATVLTSNVIQPYAGQLADRNAPGESGAEVVADQPNPAAVTGGEQIVLTQDELNQRISNAGGGLGVLDRVRVEIEPHQLTLHASAYGVSGRYHGTVQAREGRLELVDGRSSGMLGWLVPVDQLESTLNREMNAALSEAGVSVESVALEPGRMILGINA